jgi:lipopolysaccharide export LptBFGC system permease protein LptF
MVAIVLIAPIEALAVGYWRRPSDIRLAPVPSIAFAALALSTLGVLIALGRTQDLAPWLVALLLVAVAVGPLSLIADGVRRLYLDKGGQPRHSLHV